MELLTAMLITIGIMVGIYSTSIGWGIYNECNDKPRPCYCRDCNPDD